MKLVKKYIDDIQSGEIVACRYVKAAVQRHVDDLETGHERGLFFDEAAAQKCIDFFGYLKLWENPGAGKPFFLLPHWRFIIANLIGWKRKETGYRRFVKFYCEMARKSCKSAVMGGLALYLFIIEREPGCQIVTAATKKKQAKIIWNHSKNLLLKSDWKNSAEIRQYSMITEDNFGVYEYLARESNSDDGLSLSAAFIDEYHQHKTASMLEALETATQHKDQPLIGIVTTSGGNYNSVCYTEERSYTHKILTVQVEDDSYFGVIFTLDQKTDHPDLVGLQEDKPGTKEDDFRDESVWVKSNPGIEYGLPTREKIRNKVKQALETPTKLNSVLIKHFNIWTSSVSKWIDINLWDANAGAIQLQPGLKVWGGVDLSGVGDLTSFVWVYNIYAGDVMKLGIIPFFWCTEYWLNDPKNKYSAMFRQWAEDGYVFIQENNAIDYNDVRQQMLDFVTENKLYVQDVGVEAGFSSHEFCIELNKKLGGTKNHVKVGKAHMGQLLAAIDETERLLLNNKIINGDNPVLRFCIGNTQMKLNWELKKRIWKQEGDEKIDGSVALLMAVLRWIVNGGSKQKPTSQPSSGIIVL